MWSGKGRSAAIWLLFLLLAGACSPGPMPVKRKILPIDIPGEARSYGIYTYDGMLDESLHVTLRIGEPYRRVFALTQFGPEKRSYGLVVLVNLRQQPIRVQRTSKNIHVFEAHPQKGVEVPVELDLEPGRNEVIFLLFKEPEAKVADLQQRTRLEGVAAQVRQVIIVGKESQVAAAPVPPLREGANTVLHGLHLSKSGDDLTMWLWEEARPGQTLPLYLRAGNTGKAPMRFAVIGFLNWRQVDLTPESPALFGEVQPERIGTWEHLLEVPGKPGLHDFQAVMIPEPYHPTMHGPRIDGTFRLGITVP